MKNALPIVLAGAGVLVLYEYQQRGGSLWALMPGSDDSGGHVEVPHTETPSMPDGWGSDMGYGFSDGYSVPGGNAGAAWVPPTSAGRERAAPYVATLEQISRQNSLPAGLLTRVAWQESRFRPDIIDGSRKSPVGAVGMFQFMPATAAQPGYGVAPLSDPTDWLASAKTAGAYLAALRERTDNWEQALAAYNWGLGNVYTYGVDSSRTPKETRQYADSVTRDLGIA